MPRFVILRHHPGPHSKRPLHWDLMFEDGIVLRTFACANEPLMGLTFQVDSIEDHRLAYLEYEGTVSGGRGDVQRWDCGDFTVKTESPGEWLLHVSGQRWQGNVRFAAGPDQRWTVTFDDPETV